MFVDVRVFVDTGGPPEGPRFTVCVCPCARLNGVTTPLYVVLPASLVVLVLCDSDVNANPLGAVFPLMVVVWVVETVADPFIEFGTVLFSTKLSELDSVFENVKLSPAVPLVPCAFIAFWSTPLST